ncbi:hypothetical protein AURANDRAFT_8452, partial [Aureococcus anophagefferens]
SAEEGSAEGAYELSLLYAHGKGTNQDKAMAKKWLILAAERGSTKAQLFIANLYTKGGGGFEKDEAKAFTYISKAADAGSAEAHRQLGVRYMYGSGVAKDLDAAVASLEKAASLGADNATDYLEE